MGDKVMKCGVIFKFCLLLLGITFLSACTGVEEVSKKNEEAMVNYMARAVTNHSKTTRNKLIPVRKKDLEKKVDIEKEEQDKKERPVPEKKGPTMGEVLGCSDIGFTIGSVKLQNSYVEGSYLNLQPSGNDKEFLVVRFKMRNNSKKMINFQTGSKNVQYVLHIGNKTISPLMTLAQDDIMYLEINLKPNETGNALLFYQVNKEQKYDDTYLEVACDGKECKMPFKIDKKNIRRSY